MLHRLPHEFRKYARNSLHLSRILDETKKAVKDIEAAGILSEDELESCDVAGLESERLSSTFSEKPIMFVFGQSTASNALFVNTFLDCSLLPTTVGDWRWLRILFGRVGHVSLTVGMEFEVMDKLRAHEKPWNTVPEEDILRPLGDDLLGEHVQFLEIERCHPTLRDGLQIVIPPILDPSLPGDRACLRHVVQLGLKSFLPLLVYTVESTVLSDQDIRRLQDIREVFPDCPVFFIVNIMAPLSPTKDGIQPSSHHTNGMRTRGPSSTELTESEQHALEQQQNLIQDDNRDLENLDDGYFSPDSQYVSRLVKLGYLSEEDASQKSKCTHTEKFCRCTLIVEGLDQMGSLFSFVKGVLRSHLVYIASILNEVHTGILRRFILCAFDMAREIQITPRRMKYAIEKEMELYHSLTKMASEQQAEVTQLITDTLENMREQLIDDAAVYVYRGAGDVESNSRAARAAAEEIQKVVLNRLTHAVARRLMCSMGCMQDSVVGTLQRTLCSLERPDRTNSESLLSNSSEEVTVDLSPFENLSESFQEINSIECAMSGSTPGHQLASNALKQILSAAYAVQLSPTTPSTLLFGIFERIRQLLHGVQLPWSAPPRLDAAWRRRVATEMLDSLSPARLARSISSQFREKVRLSHEHFQNALRSLENHYSGRLERTEEQRVSIRKYHAPRFAKLALESTSMADIVRYGTPQLGREIGRGQYGVVFACDSWGGAGPCAVKSVVPPDDKHWHDLAMEFYYTRSIPEHPRIVRLRGSVVDHTYGGGSSIAVLLVMDRLNRDLFTGLHDGLLWNIRLRIAVDVVEGIRYLHSQGLVHRDIKLKNVLLDCNNRAKLTDLGFCIPEAMMSGSIVGTPVHMAPELLSGHYDSSVDVYAFGILFWFICAGSVRLPLRFDKFHNKEQLWTSVRKGVRPERLAQFDDDCWQLMEQCWNGDPSARPLLGYVQPQLEAIMNRYTVEPSVIES